MAMSGMRNIAAGFTLFLAGCGAGGGSLPQSPSPAPVPTNVSLETLSANQSFTGISATQTAQFDLSSSNTVSGSSASVPLTIAYNASDGTYTISTAGRSQSFAAVDITSKSQGQAVFVKSGTAGRDYLTLWAPSYGGSGPRYVGMGLWQRNVVSGNLQDTTLDLFTYGIESAASAVPRAGTAAFATNVFGVTTRPGNQPRSFSGAGNFDVDFTTGVFNSVTPVAESELVSGAGLSGGGIQVVLAGTLSAGNGAFSGFAAYGGGNARSQGTVAGRFYGPVAGEIGAAFTAIGADGSSATGALVGAKTGNPVSANLALSNPVVGELFYTSSAWVELLNNGQAAIPGMGNSQLSTQVDGSFSFPGPRSDMAYGSIAASDQIAPVGANFVSYRKSLNGFTVTVDFYKPGSSNGELPLTYTSFAHFNELLESLNQANRFNIYSLYGIPPGDGIVQARKGTAHYSGVAYGTGINAVTNSVYRITGTSSFDADFTSATLSGALVLTARSGSDVQNYGTLNFGTTIVNGYPVDSGLSEGGVNWGAISARFFGPTAQEIGATFNFTVPAGQPGANTVVAGAAVAR